jgi:hypothetical protein
VDQGGVLDRFGFADGRGRWGRAIALFCGPFMTSESLENVMINVQLEPKDLERYRRFLGVQTAGRMWWNLICGFLGLVLITAASASYGKSRSLTLDERLAYDPLAEMTAVLGRSWWLLFVALFLVAYGFAYWRNTRGPALEAHAPGVFKPVVCEVSGDGLLSRSDRGETLNYWHSIARFAETKEDFYVMLASRNGHILPKRCFESAEAMTVFQNQMRLYLEKFAPAALAAGKPS